MTYKELLERLKGLSEEQLNCDVTVYDDYGDEYHGWVEFGIVEETDVLDKDHPILILKQ